MLYELLELKAFVHTVAICYNETYQVIVVIRGSESERQLSTPLDRLDRYYKDLVRFTTQDGIRRYRLPGNNLPKFLQRLNQVLIRDYYPFNYTSGKVKAQIKDPNELSILHEAIANTLAELACQ